MSLLKMAMAAKMGRAKSYNDLKDKPCGLESTGTVPAVDISINPTSSVGWFDPETEIYYVSDQVFTKEELTDKNAPFYIDLQNTYDETKSGTFNVSEAERFYELDGGFYVVKNIPTSWGGFAPICVLVTNKPNVELGSYDTIFEKTGLYVGLFYEVHNKTRLYRNEGETYIVKKLDNQFLDLENHPVIKDILSKL